MTLKLDFYSVKDIVFSKQKKQKNMKTKNLYILGKGLVILFLLIIFVIPSILWHLGFLYSAIGIVTVLVCICVFLYMFNNPENYMNKFLGYDEKDVRIHKLVTKKYVYHRSVTPFSCGHANIQMVLEKYGIVMSQNQILKIAGDEKRGMMSWEVESTLNDILLKRGLQIRARVNYYTTHVELFDAIQKGDSVIVLFMNNFNEKGYSSHAHYPHFALLNNINMSSEKRKDRVILTSPTFTVDGNKNYISGRNIGEIIIPFTEFQKRFYANSEFLNIVEYYPTQNGNILYRTWNKFLNVLFIFGLYIGYCTRIVKPGLAIFVEPIGKR